MTIHPDVNSPETVLRRIDAILDELLALRESVRGLLSVPAADAAVESQAPGHRVLQAAEDITRYLREEPAAWDS